jgi:hypothetical protein
MAFSSAFLMLAPAFPWFPGNWPFPGSSDDITMEKFYLALSMVAAIFSGFIAVGVRWWALSAEKQTQSQS